MLPPEYLIQAEENKDLSALNTLGFSARAAYFCQPDSVSRCQQALAWAQQRQLPVFALGGGSNLILAADIPGLTLQMSNCERHYLAQSDGSVQLKVGAGVVWHELVMETVNRGLYGLENLALIPGRVGAAPIQNIGAYGVELADILEAVQVVRVRDGAERLLTAQECALSYRDSLFKTAAFQPGGQEQVIITGLILRLQTQGEPKLTYGDLASYLQDKHLTPLAVAEAVCTIRSSKLPDPAVLANVGSFFKNPLVSVDQAEALKARYPDLPVYPAGVDCCKLAAGWLIERCGFKGIRRGSVGVYPKQALVLVHYGQGDASELLALADEIVAAVAQTFAVQLEREPQLLSAS